MEWKILSMIEVDFNKKKLSEENIQILEGFLRKWENIDNLIIHNRKFSFYVWSRDKADYGVLDELKAKLKDLGYSDFEISANEYVEKGVAYHYSSAKDNK